MDHAHNLETLRTSWRAPGSWNERNEPKMNENFKWSKSAQNDLESVCIGPGSVPAEF